MCKNTLSCLTRLGSRKGIRSVKKWWGAGMVICLERGADLHTAQLMPLPLTVSCFGKIQVGFTFLVPADPGSPEKGPLNGCVCYAIHTVIVIVTVSCCHIGAVHDKFLCFCLSYRLCRRHYDFVFSSFPWSVLACLHA